MRPVAARASLRILTSASIPRRGSPLGPAVRLDCAGGRTRSGLGDNRVFGGSNASDSSGRRGRALAVGRRYRTSPAMGRHALRQGGVVARARVSRTGSPNTRERQNKRTIRQVTPAISAAAGMVITQATTMRCATFQRTAAARRAAPTPTIAPVIVCVVETGTPSPVARNSVIAPPVSAQKPWIGFRCVMRDPIVCTIRQPPSSVPSAIAAWQLEHHPERDVELAAQHALRIEQHGDDAHRLLRVVAAVSERIHRRREELQDAEPAIDRIGRPSSTGPVDDHHQELRQHEPEQRRQHDAERRHARGPLETTAAMPALAMPAPASPPISAWLLLDGMPSPHVMTFQTIAPDQRAEDDAAVDDAGADDARADGLRDVQAEHGERDEIEEGRPDHGDLRAQHARRDDRGDRVRGVVQAVQEIEHQRDGDEADQEGETECSCVHVGLARWVLPPFRRAWW